MPIINHIPTQKYLYGLGLFLIIGFAGFCISLLKPNPTFEPTPTPTPTNMHLASLLLSDTDLSDTWVISTYQIVDQTIFPPPLEGAVYKGMRVAAVPLSRTKHGRQGTNYWLFQHIWQYRTNELAEAAYHEMETFYQRGAPSSLSIHGFHPNVENLISHCNMGFPEGDCQLVLQKGVYLIQASTYIGEGIITEEDWGVAMMAIQAKLLEHTAE